MSNNKGIVNIKFNQDQGLYAIMYFLYPRKFILGCFVCCMQTGLRIYNVEPLVGKAHYGMVCQ